MAEEELAVRSEKPSLESLRQTLAALRASRETDEIAMLLTMVTEFYADSSCRCEELGAAYGEESEESRSCEMSVGRSRDMMLETYKGIIRQLKGE